MHQNQENLILRLLGRGVWIYNYHVMLASAMKYSMMVCIFHENRYLVGKNFLKSIMFVSLRSGKYYSLFVIYMLLFFLSFFFFLVNSLFMPTYFVSLKSLPNYGTQTIYISIMLERYFRKVDVYGKSEPLQEETVLLACFLGLLKHSKIILLCA